MDKFIIALILVMSMGVKAQETDISTEADELQEKVEEAAPEPSTELLEDDVDPILEAQKNADKPKKPKEKINFKEDEDDISDISQLGNLAPFSDIAVIQKRFLPKTGRFEFFPNIGAMVNNPFFFNSMLSARIGYNLNEKFSIEAAAGKIFPARQRITKNLEEDKRVFTSSYIIPDMFFGADLRWSPIYGKMGFFNDSIIPFDMYFSAGAGITSTNQDTSPVTLHIGTGQIFALSKSMAARWDVSAYTYNSTTRVPETGVSEGTFTDLYVSLGMCFFFPEASYR